MIPRSPLRRASPLGAGGARKPVKHKTRLASSGRGLARRRKKLRECNPYARKKREARYRAKLARARRGEGYKLAMQRAGGRCEHLDRGVAWLSSDDPRDVCWPEPTPLRCGYVGRLHAHHKTYARFGGDELPEDLEFLCPQHHELAESRHPTRRKWYAR